MFVCRQAACLLLLTLALGFVPAVLAVPPLTIEGRVEDSAGAPLRMASVELRPQVTYYNQGIADLEDWLATDVVTVTKSDRQGEFQLTAPESGMWEVWVTAKGFMPVRYKLTPLLGAMQLPAARLGKAQRLLLRILGPKGEPIAGARVGMGSRDRNRQPSWEAAIQRGVADGAGKVRLSWSDKPSLVLVAGAPGFVPSALEKVESGTMELRLGAAVPCAVVVRDHQGRPVAGALARVGDGYWPAGSSDETGLLEFWAPAEEEVQLWVSTDEGRGSSVKVATLGPGTESGTASTQAEAEAENPPRDEPQVVTLPAVTWLKGRVVEAESQRPLARAFVFQNRRAAKFVLSDAQGRFRLTASAARPPYITAAKAGYLPSYSKVELEAGQEYEAPKLALVASTHIDGRVVDEQGQPVRDVLVTVSRDRSRGSRSGWTPDSSGYSNSEGRFRLDSLRPSSHYILHVQQAKFAPLRQPVATEAEGPTSVELVLPVGHLGFGTVVDLDEIPVAGATVRLVEQTGGDIRSMMRRAYALREAEGNPAVSTDAKGRFEILDLGAGHFDLVVSAAGFSALRVPGIEIPAHPGQVDLGTVLLEPGVTVEGWVVDPQGEPISGAQITVDEQENWMRRLDSSAVEEENSVVTDQTGFFSLPDLRNGSKVQLEVVLTGFVTKSVPGVEAPSIEPLTVVLQPSSRIAGRVLNLDGEPVSGAQVVVAGSSARGMRASGSFGQTLSDEEGKFELADLAPGTLNLKAWAAGYVPALKPALELNPGSNLEGIELVLERGATIVGRVTSTGGEPVADVTVGLVRDWSFTDRLSYIGNSATGTDADGEYRLEGVALGLVSVEATSQRYTRAVKDLQVRAGENRLDLVLEAGFEISGRVVDNVGGPVAGAQVTVRTLQITWRSMSETTAADGGFTLVGVANGSYRLGAEHETKGRSESQTSIEVSGANVEGIELRLAESAKIVGRLLGLELEELGDVTIIAFSQSAGGLVSGEVDYEGRYRLEGLSSGEWQVMAAHAPSGKQVAELVVIPGGQEEATLDLDFGGGLTLSGIVIRRGEPVAGQQVALLLAQVPSAVGETDQRGQFKLSGLKEGQYQLFVRGSEGGPLHTEDVELTADREIRVEIVVTVVRGTVVDASDRSALAAVRISAQRVDETPIPGGRSMGGGVLSGESGQFNLGELATGRWRVVARKEGFEQAEAEIEVSTSPIDNLRLAMQPGGGLTFFVSREQGGSMGRVIASVVDPTGRSIAGGLYTPREAGRVHIASVPRGQWELLLYSGDSAVASAQVVVPGPAATLALTPGAQLELTVPDLVAEGGAGHLQLVAANGRPLRKPRGPAPLLAQYPVAAGRASFTNLPPGSWQAVVTTTDGRTWSAEFTASAGQTVQVRLE